MLCLTRSTSFRLCLLIFKIKKMKNTQVKTVPAVLYQQEGKVAIITLNRPKSYNAVNHDLALGLIDALRKAETDSSVNVIVLTGAGRGFCAGADMSLLDETPSPEGVRDYINMFHASIARQVSSMKKLVIGALNGPVAGVGLAYALACDMRIMADTANMRYAFINIGLGPDGGAGWFLVQTVGYAKAIEIAIEGEKIPAARCLELNLTNKVVPAADLMKETLIWTNKLAERPTLAAGLTKRGLRYSMTHGMNDSINYEAEQQVVLLKSEDHREGVTAFLQKRKPNFKGK